MALDAQISTFSRTNNIITYYSNGAVKIDLDNILTIDKIIYPEMILLKNEGSQFDVIRVLSINDEDGIVYINIQDRSTGREYEISHLLYRSNGYFVWSLLSKVCLNYQNSKALIILISTSLFFSIILAKNRKS